MSAPAADVNIGFRGPASLGERLAAAAQRENNGVSAVIRRLLTDGLDREEKAREQLATVAPRKRAS